MADAQYWHSEGGLTNQRWNTKKARLNSVRKVVKGEENYYYTYRVMNSEGKYTDDSLDMMIGGGVSPRFCTASQIALEILSLSRVRYSWNAPPLHSNERH